MKATPFRERQLQNLMRIVCSVGGVHPHSLIYGGKVDALVFSRLLFYYTARSYLGASFPAIAMVANRDHTTIMSGVRTVQGRIDTEHQPTLAALGLIREKLGIGMARETKTIVTCARCGNSEPESTTSSIEAYVLRELNGKLGFEKFRSLKRLVLHDLGCLNGPNVEDKLRTLVSVDLCAQCVEKVLLP